MAVFTKRETLLNISTGPHARGPLTTRMVMLDVVISLLPATILGVLNFGWYSALVVLTAVLSAVLTEAGFCWAAKKKQTVGDLSAVVTGLMLALCLPADVPLYVPFLGSLFAILFVKCFFGGLGKNVMNPALTARCFLLIAFGNAMTNYTLDGVTTATPLAMLANGQTVSLYQVFLGTTSGVIGCSALGLIAGAAYLLIIGGITWEIPAATILSYTVFVGLFGAKGFDPEYLAVQLCTGGVLMGAFFMATDPVTCPTTSPGQLVYGVVVGLLSGLFRVKGTTQDSVSYAIIMSNLVVPFIDMIMVPKPYAYRAQREKGAKLVPKAAVALCAIGLVAGLALSGVYTLTKDTIYEQQLAASAASYREVLPDAQDFVPDENLDAAIAALNGEPYGENFGRSIINKAIAGRDASGATVGYVFSVTSKDGFEGDITFSLGLTCGGTVTGISFTELNETPGKGSLCGEPAFTGQFKGVSDASQVNAISGATVSSDAILNAAAAALDFFAANVPQ